MVIVQIIFLSRDIVLNCNDEYCLSKTRKSCTHFWQNISDDYVICTNKHNREMFLRRLPIFELIIGFDSLYFRVYLFVLLDQKLCKTMRRIFEPTLILNIQQ